MDSLYIRENGLFSHYGGCRATPGGVSGLSQKNMRSLWTQEAFFQTFRVGQADLILFMSVLNAAVTVLHKHLASSINIKNTRLKRAKTKLLVLLVTHQVIY